MHTVGCVVCACGKKCVFQISSVVLKMPVCTRVQGRSANPARWSTPPLSVEPTATAIPPRYPRTHTITAISHLSSHDETHILNFTPSSVRVAPAQCKLDYQACITGKKIAVKCAGVCPCPAQPEQSSTEKKGTRFCTHDCTLQARRNSKFPLIKKPSMVSKPPSALLKCPLA